MNIKEYNLVKNYNYEEYCDYLKKKYGEAKYNYFSVNWTKNNKITRTKEGLFCHHIYENICSDLSNRVTASKHPYFYQEKENLCYCDYLEHMLLHILIYENNDYPMSIAILGGNGLDNFIIPELDNVYFNGYVTNQEWRRNCHNKIINDKNVYLLLKERYQTKQEAIESLLLNN